MIIIIIFYAVWNAMMNSISNFANLLTVRCYNEFNTKFVPTHQPVDKLPPLLIFLITTPLFSK